MGSIPILGTKEPARDGSGELRIPREFKNKVKQREKS